MNRIVKVALLLCAFTAPGFSQAAWDGAVDWAQRTALSTATSGVVDKVLVRAGDRVKKGAILMQLEQGALRARLQQARAEMKHQKLLREEATRELERSQELYDRTLLADHDLDLAKIADADAEASYQRSRAAYHQAQEDVKNSELRAPFDALIVARLVQPAETVVTELRAEPMLVVAAAGKMLVRFPLAAADLASLSLGKDVNIEAAGKRYTGKIEAISQSGDRMEAEAVFAVDTRLAPGSKATVSLP